jgi:hypothetical protein
MILISVKSEVIDFRRQFEKDLDAERYLKRIKRLINLHRVYLLRPLKREIAKHRQRSFNKMRAIRFYKYGMQTAIPLRIEIINTNANQLQLQIK